MGRCGVTPAYAGTIVRTNTTVIGSIMLQRGEADAMLCGVTGRYRRHIEHVRDIIGLKDGVRDLSALDHDGAGERAFTSWPTPMSPSNRRRRNWRRLAVLAADEARRFGIEPKIALLSHSNFGSSQEGCSKRMRSAVEILHRDHPDLEVDGEMHADTALDPALREMLLPDSRLSGEANILIMPSIDAANIAYNVLKKRLANGLTVGPMLVGTSKPAHVLTNSVTARGIVNMSALAVVDAQEEAAKGISGPVTPGVSGDGSPRVQE